MTKEAAKLYLTNTVANGQNEKGTEILDFEYNFPVDSSSGDNTFRQYAPMSAANAEWDVERLSGEKAKYKCLDSGQGCGGGTTENTLSGNWISTTEGSNFSGYYIKEWNLNMNEISEGHNGNHLLNADNDGTNAGSGTGINTLLALGQSDSGDTKTVGDNNHPMSGGEVEFYTVSLPESFNYFGKNFTHLHVNENGFVTLGNDKAKPYNDAGINFISTGTNAGAFHFNILMKLNILRVVTLP